LVRLGEVYRIYTMNHNHNHIPNSLDSTIMQIRLLKQLEGLYGVYFNIQLDRNELCRLVKTDGYEIEKNIIVQLIYLVGNIKTIQAVQKKHTWWEGYTLLKYLWGKIFPNELFTTKHFRIDNNRYRCWIIKQDKLETIKNLSDNEST
jgi:hypothetical protein